MISAGSDSFVNPLSSHAGTSSRVGVGGASPWNISLMRRPARSPTLVLQQGGGCQPVGAVEAGARDFAHGEQIPMLDCPQASTAMPPHE